jgi:hypothetical protein
VPLELESPTKHTVAEPRASGAQASRFLGEESAFRAWGWSWWWTTSTD